MADRAWAWTERLRIGGLLLLGTLASILTQGFSFPNNGNAYHFPIIFDYAGSAEGPHDLYAESLQYFVTYFWLGLRAFVTEENVAVVFHLAFLLLRLLSIWLLYRIADQLVPGRRLRAAGLAALFFTGIAWWYTSPIGHGEVLLDTLSHSTVNLPVMLALWWAALARRWVIAGLIAGAGFNANAFVALWLAGAAALALLWSEKDQPWRRRLVMLAGFALAFAFLAAPTAIRILGTLEATRQQLPSFDFRDFLRAFYGGHFFGGYARWGEWLLFLLLLTGLALTAPALALSPQRQPRVIYGLAAGVLCVVAFGLVVPLLSGSSLLLNLHPLRLDFALVWLALTVFVVWSQSRQRLDAALAAAWIALFGAQFALLPLIVAVALDSHGKTGTRRAVGLTQMVLAAAVLLSGEAPALSYEPQRLAAGLLALLLILWLAVAWPSAWRRLDLLMPTALIAVLELAPIGLLAAPRWAMAAALLLAALAAMRPGFGLPGWTAWVLAAAACALGIVLALANRESLSGLAFVGAALAVPLVGCGVRRLAERGAALGGGSRGFAGAVALAALLAVLPGARHLASTGHLDRYDDRALAFLELQRWARGATPPDSLFLQPDEQLAANLTPSFWTLSRRPAWVDWRMGAATHWLPDFYWLWTQRMAEVTALHDVAAKLAYARAHAIPYVILAADGPLPAGAPAPLYEDGFWRVLPVR